MLSACGSAPHDRTRGRALGPQRPQHALHVGPERGKVALRLPHALHGTHSSSTMVMLLGERNRPEECCPMARARPAGLEACQQRGHEPGRRR